MFVVKVAPHPLLEYGRASMALGLQRRPVWFLSTWGFKLWDHSQQHDEVGHHPHCMTEKASARAWGRNIKLVRSLLMIAIPLASEKPQICCPVYFSYYTARTCSGTATGFVYRTG